MPATYEPIATTTLGSAASSITFSSIPGTYTDCKVVLRAVLDGTTASSFRIRFNSDTGTNYSRTGLSGNGTSASSFASTSATGIVFGGVDTSGFFVIFDVFSYAGSTNKTVLLEQNMDNNGSGSVGRIVGLWRNTNAITAIELSTLSGDFPSGTTATLYGILKA